MTDFAPENRQGRVKILDNARWHGGKRSADPTMIILHTSEGESALSSIEYLNTTGDKKASYHYIIERDGTVYRMTNPDLVAYHAGDSNWPHPIPATPKNPDKPNGGHSLNSISLGFCWANDGKEPIRFEQKASMLWLIKVYTTRYDIPPSLIRGHLEVSPLRKFDPPASLLSMDDFRRTIAEYLTQSHKAGA